MLGDLTSVTAVVPLLPVLHCTVQPGCYTSQHMLDWLIDMPMNEVCAD